MPTLATPRTEYNELLKRQRKFEEEFNVLKAVVQDEIEESRIRPSVLRRWDRISRDLDKGQGYIFSSTKDALRWLKNL